MTHNDTVTITCSVKTLRRIYEALTSGYIAALDQYANASNSNPVAFVEDCSLQDLEESHARAVKYFERKKDEIDACCKLACDLLIQGEIQVDPYPSFPRIH